MAVAERQAKRAEARNEAAARLFSEGQTAPAPYAITTPDGTTLDQMAAPLRAQHAAQAAELREAAATFANKDEAVRAAQILRSKEGEWDEERLAKGWARVNRYVSQHPQQFQTKAEKEARRQDLFTQYQEEAKQAEGGGGLGAAAIDVGRHTLGVISVAGSILNSALAEPSAGARGLYELVTTGDSDKAAQAIADWRDAVSFVPVTQEGQELLSKAVVPLQYLDETAMDVSGFLGRGNSYGSAAVYTAIMGIPDVLGFKGGQALKVSKKMKAAEEAAKRLGVPPTVQTMPSDIMASARRMSSTAEGDSMPAIQEALVKAKADQAKRIEGLKAEASQKKAFVNAEQAQAFAQDFTKRMANEGYDVSRMPRLQDALGQIDELGETTKLPASTILNKDGAPVRPAQEVPPKPKSVQKYLQVRNRVNKALESMPERPRIPEEVNEKTVLFRFRREMDQHLMDQFNQDMITGSPEAIDLWKNYNGARDHMNRMFHGDGAADKIITRFIEQEATPEQLKRWLLGANSANALPNAAKVIERMKEVLGPNHPALQGIRSDLVYDLVKPLFDEKGPNLDAFIRNVDNTVSHRKSLWDVMDMNASDLKTLRNLAEISRKNPPMKTVKLVKDWSMAFSRMMPWAHSISKAGLKVSFMANLFRKLAGEHPANQRKILAQLAESEFGGPAVPRGSVAAGTFIEAAFLADWKEAGGESMEQE